MMKTKGTRIVAAAASLGSLLQGWDSAAIAGALLYIKPEFNLESRPVLEGSIVAMTLVGATISTAIAGPGADWLGRRAMLCISAVLYSIGALLMAWSPTIYVLMIGRLVDGFGIGLAVTIAPLFISETAPAEIRGELNTLPQLAGSGGMLLAYSMAFGWSLSSYVRWRMMLGVLLIPSLIYLALGIFFLPESPRWLVSKGKMLEAKQVLQQLRNREDVLGEMALLVEGLAVGEKPSLEEYIMQPVQKIEEGATISEDGQIKIFDPDVGLSWIAKPLSSVTVSQGFLSRRGSMELQGTPRIQSIPLMDPMVSLIGSLRSSTFEHLPELGSLHNDVLEESYEPVPDGGNDHWDDEESVRRVHTVNGYHSDDEVAGELDENLESPLLSRHTSAQWEAVPFGRLDSLPFSTANSMSRADSVSGVNSRDAKHIMAAATPGSLPPNSLLRGSFAGSVESMGIGGGWQLAFQTEDEGNFKRTYLFPEGGEQVRSVVTLPRLGSALGEIEPIQAAALVSQPAQYGKEILGEHPVGPAMLHPAESATRGPAWSDLFEGGVRRALIVGVSLQILEQFAGINAVLYFTPQILKQSGAEVLLSEAGISSDSASLLASAVSSLLMVPCIVVAMRVMDKLGRRQILLSTLPILIISLVVLVIINLISESAVVFATVSVLGVVLYICFFVMGFGPIPNIVCAEIFPTRVRGVCTAICQGAMWICDIIITELFPVLNTYVGIAGAFGLFAVFCFISWVFVFLKVPETKGMPLEVIVEFFAMSAAEGNKTTLEPLEKDGGEDEEL
eukprot:c27303_g1_i1 orf=364-2727(+)